MRVWVAAALVLPLLAGCLGGDDGRGDEVLAPNRSRDVDVLAYQLTADGPVAVPRPAGFEDLLVANVPTGYSGAEPNIGVTSSGSVFATAYETVLRSRDQGYTWENVFTQTIGETSDPMLWVDPTTDRIFSPQMFPDRTCSSAIWSDDDGATWTEVPMRCGAPVMDHQKLATGPFVGALASLATTGPYQNLVSYCYNRFTSTNCAVSIDGGLTYTYDQPVDVTPAAELRDPPEGIPFSCGGLNGHQHHGVDGTIFLPYGYNCQQARVAVSTDNGLTWTRHNLGEVNRELDPEITSTPDGTAYYLYRGDDQRLHLLRSDDRFASTEGPFDVTPRSVKSTMFAGMTSGADGRVAIAYLGTTDTDQGPDKATASTIWHAYVAMSLDADAAEPTWVTVRITPRDDPVQRGSICDQSCREDPDGRTTDRNLLDFIDLSLGPDGRFWLAYADGCTSKECTTPGQLNPATSRDDLLTIAHLANGPSLLGDEVLTETAPTEATAAPRALLHPAEPEAAGAMRAPGAQPRVA